MGRAACTEPQCLYKGAFYLYIEGGCEVPTVGYVVGFNFCIKDVDLDRAGSG